MIKKILVSQPKPSSEKSPYYDIATRFGVELVFRPFIKVEGLTAKEFRTQKINILDYTAVVFSMAKKPAVAMIPATAAAALHRNHTVRR